MSSIMSLAIAAVFPLTRISYAAVKLLCSTKSTLRIICPNGESSGASYLRKTKEIGTIPGIFS